MNEIIERLKRKDEKAFNVMFDKYYRIVFYIINGYLRDKNTTEELVSDCFYAAYLKISSLKNNDKFESWLFKIAQNKALNYLVKAKRKPIPTLNIINSISDDSYRYHEIVAKLSLILTEEELNLYIMKRVHEYTYSALAVKLHKTIDELVYQCAKIEEKIKSEWQL